MKERIWCKYEGKEINVYYYPCEDDFDCDYCSHLKNPDSETPTTLDHQQKRNKQGDKYNRDIGRKLDRLNRLMAIKRHPQFQQDYKDLLEARANGDEERIVAISVRVLKRWGEEIEQIGNADELYEQSRLNVRDVEPVTSVFSEPLRVLRSGKNNEIVEEKLLGDDLYLRVNINAPLDKLVDDFKDIVSRYQGLAGNRGRTRKFQVDPWLVYDLHTEGKSLVEITREMFGLEGNPVEDGWEAEYRTVIRACKHAKQLVAAIKPRG